MKTPPSWIYGKEDAVVKVCSCCMLALVTQSVDEVVHKVEEEDTDDDC